MYGVLQLVSELSTLGSAMKHHKSAQLFLICVIVDMIPYVLLMELSLIKLIIRVGQT